jgi:mono/diheme cytochrome c family protein
MVATALVATVSLFGCSGADQAASSAGNTAANAANAAADAAATAAASAADAAKDAAGAAKDAAGAAAGAAGAAAAGAGHAMTGAAHTVAMAGDVAHGKALYAQNCAACHGANAEGGAVGPKLAGGVRKFAGPGHAGDVAWIKNPKSPMPKLYPSQLNDKDVNDVAAYVESLK